MFFDKGISVFYFCAGKFLLNFKIILLAFLYYTPYNIVEDKILRFKRRVRDGDQSDGGFARRTGAGAA